MALTGGGLFLFFLIFGLILRPAEMGESLAMNDPEPPKAQALSKYDINDTFINQSRDVSREIKITAVAIESPTT